MSATKGRILENGHHLILTIVAGALNFIPVFTSIESKVEGSFYASSLNSDVFRGGSLVLLTLIVPLGFDVLFDILNGDTKNGGSGGKKNSARSSIGDITVNSLETIVFFFGLAIWPISAFLPQSTSRLALISLCCRKAATNMVGGAFVSSLSRYDDWTRPSLAKFLSVVVIVLLCAGGILSTFAENATASGHLTNPIYYVAEAFSFVGGATIVIMCALWLISIAESSWVTVSKLNASKSQKDAAPKKEKDDSKGSGGGAGGNRSRHPSSLLALLPFRGARGGESEASQARDQAGRSIGESVERGYMFFRVVHVCSGIILTALAIYLEGSFSIINEADGRKLLDLLFPYLIFAFTMLIFSLRKLKYAAVDGLMVLLDAKKQYVRYISHEIRTPLNSVFMGLKVLLNDFQNSSNAKEKDCFETLTDINLSCVAAIDILNDLLCFDKLESGILQLHKTTEPVLPFVGDCVRMFAAQARERGVTITMITRHSRLDSSTPTPVPPPNASGTSSPNPGQQTAEGTAPAAAAPAMTIPHVSSNHSIHARMVAIQRAVLGSVSDRSQLQDILSTDVVVIDKFKMDQVIRNLISNALKFSPRNGRITVTVGFMPRPMRIKRGISHSTASAASSVNRSRGGGFFGRLLAGTVLRKRKVNPKDSDFDSKRSLEVDRQGKLVISVTDEGAGISLENQQRLFKEVVQFNPEKLQGGGGSGFGLYITKGIVDLHRGKIKVSSQGEGHGCTFTVEIPMRRDEVNENQRSNRGAASRSVRSVRSARSARSGRHSPGEPGTPPLQPLQPLQQMGTTTANGTTSARATQWQSHAQPHVPVAAASSLGARADGDPGDVDAKRGILGLRDPDVVDPDTKAGKTSMLRDVAKVDMQPYHKGVGMQVRAGSDKNPGAMDGSDLIHFKSSKKDLLAAVEASALPAGNTAVGPQRPPDAGVPKPKYHILVVDDSHLNRKMLSKLLKAAGHTCEEADDGDTALEKVKELVQAGNDSGGYDCILMDYVMPRMEGPVATKEMRKLGYKGRIVGLTGNGLPADIAHYLSQGANQVFVKPVDLESFERYMAKKEKKEKPALISEGSVARTVGRSSLSKRVTNA